MLRRCDEATLRALIRTRYGKEVLAEPMVDAASPAPAVRAVAAGMSEETFPHLASSYLGATAEYAELYRDVVYVMDVPFAPDVETGTRSHIKVRVDHGAWARFFDFSLHILEFRDCSLEVFLNIVRDYVDADVVVYIDNRYMDAWIQNNWPSRTWRFVPRGNMLGEALALGPGLFADLDVRVAHGSRQGTWEELGARGV